LGHASDGVHQAMTELGRTEIKVMSSDPDRRRELLKKTRPRTSPRPD
jgi:hypothetical protein